ncbi:MAG: hypothetical protein KDE31_35595, partial [Caldilineaceae bacterium]|nr:hypothetical protein [Caldilineaceae bacterium]
QAAAWYFLLFSATSSQTITMTEKSVASARTAYSLPPLDRKFCIAADRDYILAANLWVYGRRLIDQGEFARAMPIATETLQLLRKQGNQLTIPHGLASLGRLAIFQGELAKAYTYFHEAVTIAKIFQNRYIECSSKLFVGLVTLYQGETVTALQFLNESLRLSLEMQEMFLLARTYTYLAELSLLEGDLKQAQHWWTQSLAYPTFPHQNAIGAFTRILFAARLATAQQQHGRAATLFGYASRMHSHHYEVLAGPIRTLADAALATVQAALDPVLFAKAFAAGQQMAFEEVFSTILAPTPSPHVPISLFHR